VSFGALGLWVPVVAQPLGADSVPLGDIVAARWSSRDPAVAVVRDTTVDVGGTARPAAVITARGNGATVIRAVAVVGGREVEAEFPRVGGAACSAVTAAGRTAARHLTKSCS
jgi:hypothetical protein